MQGKSVVISHPGSVQIIKSSVLCGKAEPGLQGIAEFVYKLQISLIHFLVISCHIIGIATIGNRRIITKSQFFGILEIGRCDTQIFLPGARILFPYRDRLQVPYNSRG